MRQRSRWIRLLMFVCVLAVFGRLCFCDFTWWDDQGTIHQNPSLNPPTVAKVARYWTAIGRGAPLGLYIPVTYSVWGALAKVSYLEQPDPSNIHLNPWVFHTANVLLHAYSALLVFSILQVLIKSDWPAAAGALIFALHPVQVEPVGWISGMKDVLCGMLSLAAIWQYLLFVQSTHIKSRRLHYLIATVALVLAMLSKPTAMVTPLIVLTLDLVILRRGVASALRALWPWFGLSILCMIIAKLAQPAIGVPVAPLWARPLIALDSLAFYLWKLVWPVRLAVDYGRTPMLVMQKGWLWYTWIAPTVAALIIVTTGRRHRPILAAGAIFFIGVAPVMGFTPFLFQYYSGVADHYLYLSMLGVALATAYLASRFPGVATIVIVSCVLCALAGFSIHQAGFWYDDKALFTHNKTVNPRSFIAFNNLGAAYLREKDLPKAEEQFRRAIEIKPDYADARDNLAMVLIETGRTEPAIEQIATLLEIAKTMPPALRPGRLPQNLYQFGLLLMSRHEYAQAAEQFRAALEFNPDFSEARQKLNEAEQQRTRGQGDKGTR